MPCFGVEKNSDGPWAAKDLLSFRIAFKESKKVKKWVCFVRESPSLTGMIVEILSYVCLWLFTDDNVARSLNQLTDTLLDQGLHIEKWFEMDRLKISQGCVNELRGIHAFYLFVEIPPWPLYRFYLKRSYGDWLVCV